MTTDTLSRRRTRHLDARAVKVATVKEGASDVGGGTWRVPSATRDGLTYVVVSDSGGGLLCDCPAGLHNRACIHVQAVGELIAARRAADGVSRYVEQDRAERAARGRQPWVEEV